MSFWRTLKFFFGDGPSTRVRESEPGALLREATAKKERGDLDGAIELLTQFWSLEPFTSSGYPVETYLKLPMYLQKAGRRDDAWRALNVLITGYLYPTAEQNDQVLPMTRSDIYDKMRLFWQREGEPSLALRYGILSHLQWSLGLLRQRRSEEFRDCARRETIEAVVEPLLKKAKRLTLKPALSDLVEAQVRRLPDLDVDRTSVEIDRVLK